MSQSRKSTQDASFDAISSRFRDSLSCNNVGSSKKQLDSRELDLGSPVSPLTTRASVSANGAATSSSSSSSSGSVTGKAGNVQLGKSSKNGTGNHSGELSGVSETSPTAHDGVRSGSTPRNSKPGHRRSSSAGPPLIYAGSSFSSSGNNGGVSSATSGFSNPSVNLLPSGNICPSGKILKTAMASRVSSRTDTLATGAGNYGHGSIVRGGGGGGSGSGGGGAKLGTAGNGGDAEEVKRQGNEMYRKGNFVEALALYDKAIALSPENAAYRSNRGAVLTVMGRLGEAVRECEEAVRLDPGYGRAHQRLASLYLRLGKPENARHHLCFPGQHPDPAELQKLQLLEKHLNRCTDARKIGDWKGTLKETEAAIAIGAYSSPQIVACKAEAHLKLHQLDDAELTLSSIPKLEHCPLSFLQNKFFGMVADAYVLYVQAQVEMALGRFENAVSAAEKAGLIDYSNVEIAMLLNTVKMVARARTHGNDLFSSGRYAEACSAYGEGLKYDSSNSVLYCNRAVCWSKLELWEKSVEDCNQALKVQPSYTKALLRRAVSNGKLGRWAEAVRDYEVLRKELPGDNEVAESLQRAQAALKRSNGDDVHNLKFGGEVEVVSSLDKYKAAVSSPGVSVVHFKETSDERCDDISPFINMLCVRYPSVNFFKVDVEESLAIAKAESIRIVPTFKIYKNREKVKEIIRPSHQYLEDLVRSYSL